jgi:hypothetical protein
MRTTLNLDDSLIEALLERLPGVTKTEAIERALRMFLAEDATSRLRAMAGSVEIEDVSREMRRHDRRV